MTKLMEWLAVLSILFSLWLSLISNKIENNFTQENYQTLLYSPIIFVGLFGLYSASVVLYRTFTFNDCKEAAIELQKEIEESRTELKRLGFIFKESKT